MSRVGAWERGAACAGAVPTKAAPGSGATERGWVPEPLTSPASSTPRQSEASEVSMLCIRQPLRGAVAPSGDGPAPLRRPLAQMPM